ncbi:DELLA protein RGL1-like [Sesamum indicum]|uniref:DELLA protein RGL1-like n=1 Tax=Sesamum indicum TaxID=4182 RepID=A0A6I9UGX7_SESIN|nr:DELLA protein RGL1-like [Sesamum indicum]
MAPRSDEAIQDNELPLTLSYDAEAKKGDPCNLQAPFEILIKYGSQMKRLRSGKRCGLRQPKHFETARRDCQISETGGSASNCQVLSAVSIMRMATTELIKSRSRITSDSSTLGNASAFDSGVTHKHAKHLKHVLCLLDAAEKFSNQQYDEAEKLLIFLLSASHADHPIERVVTWFVRDLQERIDMENGKFDLEKEVVEVDVEQALADLKAAIFTSEQLLPFTQITHFTAIQTILDSLASAEKIHVIDIGTKLGSHWMIIVHSLANRKNFPVEQLKITVVCTPKDNVEERVEMLSSFAESMNVPLIFKIVNSEMHEFKQDQFELEAGEVVAVYMEFCLTALAASPNNIEALIGWVKNLNPQLMVVNEIEANVCASAFVPRFHEALFLCSAMFDCLEDCLEQDNQCREIIEKVYFQEIIKNSAMSEDDGSFRRCRKINFWREYFAKFGIVEMELSQPSMDQASFLVRESPCWKSCTLSMNGKCMLLGWNEIPLRSVSAWKFHKD